MSYFEPNLQPAIITNITPGVRAVIEPPQNIELIKWLRSKNLHVLPKTVVLKTGEWHLFLNTFVTEPYCDVKGKTVQLNINFDVDIFLKAKGFSNLATLQKMIIKNAEGFRN